MAMVFKFRVLSDEIDNFERVYEVMYDMTLEDFHGFICDDLDYDESNLCSFFVSDEQWGKSQEYTLIDMDEGDIARPMKDVLLGQIIKNKRDRLLFMFDIFTARSLYIELQEAKIAEEGVSYPRVTLATGEIPSQFDADAIITDDSVFDDIMDEFSDFEGSEDESDSYED